MAHAPLAIRKASQADLSALLDLYQHLTSDNLRPTDAEMLGIFDAFHLYKGSAIFVGELNAQIVTSCALVVIPNLTRGGRPYGLIENVVTHPTARRRGFGKDILHHASETAWQHGCYKVMLMTGLRDAKTLDFYTSAGFEQSKTGFQMRRIPARDAT